MRECKTFEDRYFSRWKVNEVRSASFFADPHDGRGGELSETSEIDHPRGCAVEATEHRAAENGPVGIGRETRRGRSTCTTWLPRGHLDFGLGNVLICKR